MILYKYKYKHLLLINNNKLNVQKTKVNKKSNNKPIKII